MLIRVLGSAAGGGFPQWNCGCRELPGRARRTLRVPAADARSAWRSAPTATPGSCSTPRRRSAPQIESFPGLHPRGPRHSPIAAILLTNGDLDHTLGLLSLRESHPLIVYATERRARAASSRATSSTARSSASPGRSPGGR